MSSEIRIYKEQRKLEFWQDGQLERTYRAGLGFSPRGAKIREGDGRVPEGDYYVCTKNEQSKFTLFMGLSYPNAEDAKRGLRDGIITKEEHDKIAEAIQKGLRPDWETDLGGKIGIHGKGSAYDWTAGCVALDDEDIRALWPLVEKGTPVHIYP